MGSILQYIIRQYYFKLHRWSLIHCDRVVFSMSSTAIAWIILNHKRIFTHAFNVISDITQALQADFMSKYCFLYYWQLCVFVSSHWFICQWYSVCSTVSHLVIVLNTITAAVAVLMMWFRTVDISLCLFLDTANVCLASGQQSFQKSIHCLNPF